VAGEWVKIGGIIVRLLQGRCEVYISVELVWIDHFEHSDYVTTLYLTSLFILRHKSLLPNLLLHVLSTED